MPGTAPTGATAEALPALADDSPRRDYSLSPAKITIRPARPRIPAVPKLRESGQISPERGIRCGRSARPSHDDLAIGARRLFGDPREVGASASWHSVSSVRSAPARTYPPICALYIAL